MCQGKLTLTGAPQSEPHELLTTELDSMTLLFLLTSSELMHCGNPSQGLPPALGAGGGDLGGLKQSVSGLWLKGTGL